MNPRDPVERLLAAAGAATAPVRGTEAANGIRTWRTRRGGLDVAGTALPFGVAAILLEDGLGTSALLAQTDCAEGLGIGAALREGRLDDALADVSAAFRDAVAIDGTLVPRDSAADRNRALDLASAVVGAVLESMPAADFASAAIEWADGTASLHVGCPLPIGTPARPEPTDASMAVVAALRPAPTLRRAGPAQVLQLWLPDLQADAHRLGCVHLEAALEIVVETGTIDRLRAIAAGRDAAARLGIAVGDVVRPSSKAVE